MTSYTFAVTVEAETAAQAAQVMGERIDHEEDYGFPYTVERALLPMTVDGEPYETETEHKAPGAIVLEPGTMYTLELPDGVIDWTCGGFGCRGFSVSFQRGEGGSKDVAFLTIGTPES